MKRELHGVDVLVAAGFLRDEAEYVVANTEVCPRCPHLSLFHDEQHGDEYPVYCSVEGCACKRQPPIF